MQVRRSIIGGALLATVALASCGNSDKIPQLMHIRSQSRSPDEFTILPSKPLTMPDDLAQLPAPTPGGSNITDPTPEADAVAALGGNPDAVTPAAKIVAGNGGLVSYAARFGTAAGIRQTLAAEDLEYRRKNDGRLLERIFNINVYYKAYAPMSLDQYLELQRWRNAGAATPGVPPEEVTK
jgi:hypothetical protein